MRRRSAPLGMDNLLSPFDSMFNFIPQGHEKALKHALYNALAIFLMIICVSGVIAVFYILEPFIKPLLWALLCGSVLYPLKHSLANILKRWLEELDQSSTPLFFGMILAPIQVVDSMSEWALCVALLRWKLILGFISSIILLCCSYHYTPGIILCFARASFYTLILIADSIVGILSIPLVTSVIIGHLFAVWFWWHNPVRSTGSTSEVDANENKELWHGRLRNCLRISATIVWLLTGGYLVGEGFLLKNEEYKSLRTPAFLVFFSFLTLGLISEFWEKYTKNRKTVQTGEDHSVDFSKWSIFLKGTTDEQQVGNRSSEEDDDEDVKMKKIEGTHSPAEPSSTDLMGQEKTESQNLREEEFKPRSGLLENKEVLQEEEHGDTPKHSRKICFSEDVLKENEIVGEDNDTNTETPPIDKISNQTQSSLTLHDRTDDSTVERSLRLGDENIRYRIIFQNDFGSRKYSESEEEEGDLNIMTSYNFIYGVLWACIFVQLLKNPWILQLLFLPLIMCLLHRTCRYFEVWSKLKRQLKPLTDVVNNWYEPRQDALLPFSVKGLYKLTVKMNRKMTQVLLGGVDGAASFVVMIGLMTFGLTALVFLAVQSYGESFHMLQVCGNVINSTIMNNPELSAYLPEGMENMVDSTLNNAYVYGREGLVSLIRGLLGTEESEARDKVESQVLELWDRVYQAWVMGATGSPTNGPKVTDDAVLTSWDNLLDTVKKTPALTNFNAWSQFAQENLETVMSLVNSVWMLLKGNITLFITILTTLLSVVFGGGSALFGFFISTIVFLTALFYLLNSSGQQYKPVEMISIVSPSNGQRIGKAFQAAINGVFEASFKMSVFYGMWTWFIHNLFQMQIVYIPTAIASLLAAIPFLGVYWASVPAIIDLWLAQGKSFQALLLFLAMLLPCSMVDTTIYKEIKSGGHPYLTGLSIAGGVFCLGVEGAIMGPMVLCCFLVVLNLSSDLLKDSTSETVVPVHLRRMRRMKSVM